MITAAAEGRNLVLYCVCEYNGTGDRESFLKTRPNNLFYRASTVKLSGCPNLQRILGSVQQNFKWLLICRSPLGIRSLWNSRTPIDAYSETCVTSKDAYKSRRRRKICPWGLWEENMPMKLMGGKYAHGAYFQPLNENMPIGLIATVGRLRHTAWICTVFINA